MAKNTLTADITARQGDNGHNHEPEIYLGGGNKIYIFHCLTGLVGLVNVVSFHYEASGVIWSLLIFCVEA